VAERIADFRAVASEIGRCIDGKGEVLDSASPALATLRRESRVAHERLTSRLQEVLNKSKTALQEPIITLRDGRYVVPVKAELRSQLPGIVHNVSSSGATVFLEPMETVEMGNKWRELQAEEEREIARIMRELSALVGSQAEEVAIALTALAEIDVLVAKVRYGESIGATQLPHDDAASNVDEEAVAKQGAVQRSERPPFHAAVTAEMTSQQLRRGLGTNRQRADANALGHVGSMRQRRCEPSVYEHEPSGLRTIEHVIVDQLRMWPDRHALRRYEMGRGDRSHIGEAPVFVMRRREAAPAEVTERGFPLQPKPLGLRPRRLLQHLPIRFRICPFYFRNGRAHDHHRTRMITAHRGTD